MANVGTAYVAIMPSMDGFAKAICKDFGSAGSSAGKTFGDGLSSGTEKGTSKSKSSLSNLAATAKDQAGYMGLAFEESGARLKAAITQSGAWQTLTGYATSASNGIKSAFAGIKEGISSKLSGVGSAVKAGLSNVGSIGSTVMTTAASMIPAPLKSMASTVGTILSPIASTAKAALAPMASALGQAGTEAASRLKEGISNAAGHVTDALATAAKAAGVGAAAVVAAVTAVTGAVLGNYADYEQLVGGVDKLFGSASGKLQSYAAEAYRTSGLSANQYMEQATSFSASLIASCAGDTSKAADYANLAMTTMSDNVNVFGSNMGDVQNAFQGFAKQNYTMLDNLKLGYGGTQSEMQRLIADANKLPGVMRDGSDLTIDSYADVVEAIARVQQAQGIAGTTAKEAASTISGSVGMAKAAWGNFLTALGRDDVDFSKVTTQLLESIGAVATNVAPRVATIGANIIAAFPAALSGLAGILAPIVSEALAAAWNIAAQALSSVGIKLPSVDASQILGAFQSIADFVTGTLAPAFAPVAQALGNFVSTVGPMLLPIIQQLAGILGGMAPIIAAIQATVINVATQIMAFVMPIITQLLAFINANMPLIQQVVTTVMNAIQLAITLALGVIQAVWNAVWPAIKAVIDAVWPLISTAISTAMTVIQDVINIVMAAISGDWSGVWNGIKQLASDIWNGIKSLVSGAINAVFSTISSVISSIQSAWNSAWSSVKSFFSDIWNGIKSAASDGVSAVYNTVTTIKDKILGFFSGAGSWLVESGRSILNGLKDGIMGAIGSVTSTISGALKGIRDLFPFSPAKEGPFSGHGWVLYSGISIAEALGEGFARAVPGAVGDFEAGMSRLSGVTSMAAPGITASPRAVAAGPSYTFYIDGAQVADDERLASALMAVAERVKARKGMR